MWHKVHLNLKNETVGLFLLRYFYPAVIRGGDTTAALRLRPLTAHFWRRKGSGVTADAFSFSCNSAAESSKCLWATSWWPGSTYWWRSSTCRPPAVHAWRTMTSSWRRTTPSWNAPTPWTWWMSSLPANSWTFWTQRSRWARWAEVRFWNTGRCDNINDFFFLRPLFSRQDPAVWVPLRKLGSPRVPINTVH